MSPALHTRQATPVAQDETICPGFLDFFELDGRPAEAAGGQLRFGEARVPVRDGIPRFSPDRTYADNFALLRRRHSALQLDSMNGTTDRRDTLLRRTGWPAEFFRGKLVLECGCGAGPDTEILLSLGARVLSVDLAGLDIARENVGRSPDAQFVQASIDALPLRAEACAATSAAWEKKAETIPVPEFATAALDTKMIARARERASAFIRKNNPSGYDEPAEFQNEVVPEKARRAIHSLADNPATLYDFKP